MKKRWLVAAALSLLLAAPAAAKNDAKGMPAFKAGDPEAYFIWHDAAGWHLRVTTPKKRWHAFQGVVRTLSQAITDVKPTRAPLAAKLQTTGKAIHFDFEIFEGIDGFDWQTNEECLIVELRIDKQSMIERVHVGAKGETPLAMPFSACR